MTRVVNSRIRFLLLLIIVAFAGLLARAAWIQTVRAASLSRLATAQTRIPVVLPAGRGTIFDAMGTPLALGEQATTVFADPRQISHPLTDATVAARVLGLKPKPLSRLLGDRKLGFVYVERKAPPADATALAKKNLVGFGFYPEERRVYPQKSVAAPVLGYAGVDNNGLSGLELQLNTLLTGKAGEETVVRDPLGHVISIENEKPAREGKNVFLTLDHTIQANAEQVLRATVAKWHAKDATAIVLDPHTGGVLAMAMEPGYDANAYPTAPVPLQNNHAVSDVFEPGSVFKIVTIAGALSEHLVTPQTAFTLPYSIRVADRVIHDAEVRPTERMTVAQILQRSSNVGAITIATKLLGQTRLQEWISRFGFGKPTGIDFPGRERRAAAVVLVRLDHRQRSDRPGHLGHGDPARVRVRGGRERRPVDPAASRRPRPGRAAVAAEDAPDPLAARRPSAADHAQGRRLGRRHGGGGRDPGLLGGRQDGHGAEAGAARLHAREVRGDVRGDGAGEQSAAGRPRHGGRADASPSSAAWWPRRRSRRSPRSTSSTSRYRPTSRSGSRGRR